MAGPSLPLDEIVTRARASGQAHLICEAIPYARYLGLELIVIGDEITTCMPFSEHLVGNPQLPALHGGTIGALLEHAAIFQLVWDREVVPLPKTINLTVEYLRSGRPRDTFARAAITKRGRRVANVHATAWQDDRRLPIAAANAHFLLRSAPPSDSGRPPA